MARTDVLRNNVGKCPFTFTLALGQQKLIYKYLELEEKSINKQILKLQKKGSCLLFVKRTLSNTLKRLAFFLYTIGNNYLSIRKG